VPMDSLYNIKLGDRYTTDGNDVWVVDAIRPFLSVTPRQVGSSGDTPEPSVDASLDTVGFARFQSLDS